MKDPAQFWRSVADDAQKRVTDLEEELRESRSRDAMDEKPIYFEEPETEYRVGAAADLLSELLLQDLGLSAKEAEAVVTTRAVLSQLLRNAVEEPVS